MTATHGQPLSSSHSRISFSISCLIRLALALSLLRLSNVGHVHGAVQRIREGRWGLSD